ncbi:NfeD family protein [Vibrio algicola]|uniref:NfeD family protein n=1 Tax=Vibrio algicola TaxID=2662262 RepID=A0A5Q0TGS8_9VIBR|nr:NfeD family protein [Vibrio algicola]
MDLIHSYFPQVLMALGIVLLIIEIAVFGFSTFLLFFMGLGVFFTGLSMQFNLLEANIHNAIWLGGVLTCIFALILWRPLKHLQNKPVDKEHQRTDFAQITFVLTDDVNSSSDTVLHAYSGINWKVRSQQPLSKGQTVSVVKQDVGVLWVESVD